MPTECRASDRLSCQSDAIVTTSKWLSVPCVWRLACNAWVEKLKVIRSKKKEMESEEEKLQMSNQENNKCAHIPCLCEVAAGQEYCSEACQDAGSEDVEIACQCGHTICPLTV